VAEGRVLEEVVVGGAAVVEAQHQGVGLHATLAEQGSSNTVSTIKKAQFGAGPVGVQPLMEVLLELAV
jgi:hypothetical protein